MIADDPALPADYEEDFESPDPKSARQWLASLTMAEKAFKTYQAKADNIDKLYADLNRLSADTRDRQFQLFWANVEVLKPSIYSRPPVPVVVPKFKDRRPLHRVASELLERSCITAFDLADIDQVMMLVRDDLAIVGRGVPWVRYETQEESDGPTERICIEHKHRKDFLHDPARNWSEVGWVSGAAYLSKREMRKRFYKTSGDAYQNAEYAVRKEDKDNGAADNRQKAKVWEIWSKDENKVVWVAEGCDKILDEGEPHLKLEGFFPCPRPAYATLQRGSLIPVPDMVYYKDQLEEINELTDRIHLLADAVKVRGFYPAGSGEIGDAIQQALLSNDNRQVMVPISNFAAFGNGSAKDTIIWLPIDMIVETLTGLVELRRQIIDDVYQIMGLSDIMRGATEASETATAQQIKAQYGGVRVRDKVNELVRVARDVVRIACEIMAENFDRDTLLEMTQLEIPTDNDIEQQIEALTAQAEQQLDGMVQQAMQNPEAMQAAQANPEQATQLYQKAQQQVLAQVRPKIDKLREEPTIEAVMDFLRDQKLRPFSLDIETDSTITPDENAEKERRNEFMQVFAAASERLGQMVSMEPSFAPLAGEMLKFTLAPYRAGRELEGVIDDWIDQMTQKAQEPPPPSPEQVKAQAEAKKAEADAQKTQAEAQEKAAKAEQDTLQARSKYEQEQLDRAVRQQEAEAQAAERQQKLDAAREMDTINAAEKQRQMNAAAQKHDQDMALGALKIELANTQIANARQSASLEAERNEREAAESETEDA